MRVYGGINLNLKLTEGQVPVNSMFMRFNALDVFSGLSSISVAGPRSRQDVQIMKTTFVECK